MKTTISPSSFRRRIQAAYLILSVSIILGINGAWAQNAPDPANGAPVAKPEPPSGPLLDAAPAFSQWIITYTYPEDREKKTPTSPPLPAYSGTRTRTITTTKTHDIIHEVIVNMKGDKLEEWHVGKIQYRKTAGSNVWLQNNAGEVGNGSASDYIPLSKTGFRDLDWVSKENYAGTVKYAERYCLVFILGTPPGLDLSAPNTPVTKLESVGMLAFIDLSTRLPVQIQTNGIIRFYQFTDPPTEKLTLPPDLADQIKKGQEARDRLNQRPPRPY